VELDELEKNDRILFNKRKTPLLVTETGEKEVTVKGPQGAEYLIYKENNSLLVCNKGKKKYSSYCKELRKVGRWERKNNVWTHSKTGEKIRIEKNKNGFWTINTHDVETDLDIPMYGFTGKEYAVEEVKKFVKKNPEGIK